MKKKEYYIKIDNHTTIKINKKEADLYIYLCEIAIKKNKLKDKTIKELRNSIKEIKNKKK